MDPRGESSERPLHSKTISSRFKNLTPRAVPSPLPPAPAPPVDAPLPPGPEGGGERRTPPLPPRARSPLPPSDMAASAAVVLPGLPIPSAADAALSDPRTKTTILVLT